MYKVKEASGDAYLWTKKQGVKQSNLGKGHTTLQRENRRREAMAEEKGGGRWGLGVCTMQQWVNDLLYEILRNNKVGERKKWKREAEWKDWRFEVNLAVPPVYRMCTMSSREA